MDTKKKMYIIVTITAMLCVALVISGFILVGDLGASRPDDLTATPTNVPNIPTQTLVPESDPTEASFETPVPFPTQVKFETPVFIPTVTPIKPATPQSNPTLARPTLTPIPYVPPVVVLPSATPSPRPSIPVITDWRGEYYANTDLSGMPWLVRNDMQIDFNWGPYAPANGLPADQFSARWIRTLAFEQGAYRFHAAVDDGVRVYVDGKLILNEWREGSVREVTVDGTLPAGFHTVQIEYLERYGEARIAVWWERIATYTEWKGEYWGNRQLAGNPVVTRNDKAIDFDWGLNSPATSLPADNFSARWSRTLDWNGEYRFYARTDDGIRVYVDGQKVLDYWNNNSGKNIYSIDLTLKGKHELVVEYYENVGNALIKFWWEKRTATPTATATRPATRTPTATATRPTRTPTATRTSTPVVTKTSTAVPTVTKTATPVLPRSVRLSEVLPFPGNTDWNKDGVADERDEWIELYNASALPVDIGGWMLDDGAGGSQAYRLPARTIIKAHGYLVLHRSVTGINLDDTGDKVRLIKNDRLVDSVTFGEVKQGLSYSRDLHGAWHADTLPTLGQANVF